METKHKTFKCKDEILLKSKEDKSAVWVYAVFSSYSKNNTAVVVAGGLRYGLDAYHILPYEGNEHLVGTTDEPDEEVKLEEGEWIVCFEVFADLDGDLILARFIETSELMFFVSDSYHYSYAIKYSNFNINDMEETKKHILCVKNGKVVKYKE